MEEHYGDDETVLALASLLHDIGKIRVRFDPSGTHAMLGSEEVAKLSKSVLFPEIMQRVSTLIRYHHSRVDDTKLGLNGNDRELLTLLQYADRASAAHERDDRDYTGELKEPFLEKVSSYICIDPDHDHDVKAQTFPVMTMDEFISQESPGSGYESIYRQLEKYLVHSYSGNRADYVNSVTSALLNCTSFIPSAFYYSKPNTPLFDHLKVTAAIAVSRYRAEKSGNGDRMILIKCDISGIQDYIFRHYKSEEADERATKRLRGRSFRVGLLAEAVTEAVIATLDLYLFNVIWLNSDGSLIMADHSEENIKRLEDLRNEIDGFLLDNDRGLYCVMDWVEGKFDDIPRVNGSFENGKDVSDEDFRRLLNRLLDRTNGRKKRMFSGIIAGRGQSFFEGAGPATCPTCGLSSGMETEDNKTGKCEECLKEEELGEMLVKNDRIVMRRDLSGAVKYKFGTVEISYTLSSDEAGGERVIFINPEHISDRLPNSWKIMLMGNYVPSEDGRVISINESLKIGKGRDPAQAGKREYFYLGIVKGDVDNLGIIMSEGLFPLTLPKVASFSRNLTEFFTIKVNRIAKRHGMYMIYSGGDDISALGPIDSAIRFSSDLEREFENWVGNPEITFSLGVATTRAKFPLRRGITIAEKALELSKDARRIQGMPESVDKASITAFGCTMSWTKFRDLLEFSDRIRDRISDGTLGKGFPHFLLDLDSVNPYDRERVGRGETVYYPDYYLSYYLKRNWRNGDRNDLNLFIKNVADRSVFPYIRFPATLVSMEMRKNPENEAI